MVTIKAEKGKPIVIKGGDIGGFIQDYFNKKGGRTSLPFKAVGWRSTKNSSMVPGGKPLDVSKEIPIEVPIEEVKIEPVEEVKIESIKEKIKSKIKKTKEKYKKKK